MIIELLNRFLVFQLTDKNRKIINAVAKYGKKSPIIAEKTLLLPIILNVCIQHFLWITSCLAMTQIASTIKQLNNQTVNN